MIIRPRRNCSRHGTATQSGQCAISDLAGPRKRFALQSRSFRPRISWARILKSTRRDSTATEYVDCTKAPSIHWLEPLGSRSEPTLRKPVDTSDRAAPTNAPAVAGQWSMRTATRLPASPFLPSVKSTLPRRRCATWAAQQNAKCRRALLGHISLGPRPSLHRRRRACPCRYLRSGLVRFVRRPHSYYGVVRFLVPVGGAGESLASEGRAQRGGVRHGLLD